MSPRDAFRVLGLSPGADPSDVRAAWRSLARNLHSDFHQDKPVEERRRLEDRLREVNAASDALKHFFDLPAAERSRILGIQPQETRRARLHRYQPASPTEHRARRTSLWFLLPAAALPLVLAIAWTRHGTNAEIPVPLRADSGAEWVGRFVVPVFCQGEGECQKPACRSGPLLESLRASYGIPDSWVVYGTPDRSRRNWLFHSVEPTLRSDIYSVAPQVVVAAESADGLRRKVDNSRASHACRLALGDPITLAVHLEPVGQERRTIRQEADATLQLDELETPARPGDAYTARFQPVPGEDFLSFRYGPRPEGITGPLIPGAPVGRPDIGSLYRIRYRTVEYSRNTQVVERNHEFVSVTRLTGAEQSRVYRDVTLHSDPHTAIRAVERVDIAGIRQCQAIGDTPGYTACAIRLVRSLELANRITAMTAQNLRFRFRHPELD